MADWVGGNVDKPKEYETKLKLPEMQTKRQLIAAAILPGVSDRDDWKKSWIKPENWNEIRIILHLVGNVKSDKQTAECKLQSGTNIKLKSSKIINTHKRPLYIGIYSEGMEQRTSTYQWKLAGYKWIVYWA